MKVNSQRSFTRNVQLSKAQTLKLEKESVAMEQQLQELRMHANNEKNEREQKGGSLWQHGTSGSLSSYAKDVLSANTQFQKQKGKIRLLKDEPTLLGDKKARQQKQHSSNDNSNNVVQHKCGQCEDKVAHVICVECGEDYCAACFTDFHSKGALRKHRSMPIGMNEKQHAIGAVTSLLDGSVDEAANAAEFQAAISAWRGDANHVSTRMLKDAETCMMEFPQPQDSTIVFGTSSISYAEKLLLQKYRRNLVLPSSARPVFTVQNNVLNDCDKKTVSVELPSKFDVSSAYDAVRKLDSAQTSSCEMEGLLYHPIKKSNFEVSDIDQDLPTRGVAAAELDSTILPEASSARSVPLTKALLNESVASRPSSSRPRSASARKPSATKRFARDGLLTVQPSGSLVAVSSSISTFVPNATTLTNFFLLGQNNEDIEVPVSARDSQRTALKSASSTKSTTFGPTNKLYKMCLRSWAPESSLPDYQGKRSQSARSQQHEKRIVRKLNESDFYEDLSLKYDGISKQWEEDDGVQLRELEDELAILSARSLGNNHSSSTIPATSIDDEKFNWGESSDTVENLDYDLRYELDDVDEEVLKTEVAALD